MQQFISQLIGGAVGGAAGGKAVKDSDMGNAGNAVAGAVGGVAGAQLLGGPFGARRGRRWRHRRDAGQLVGGGVAGLVVQVVVGIVLKRMRGRFRLIRRGPLD